MKVIIAAGGTGGHLYPGIVLAKEIRRRGGQALFALKSKEVTSKILKQEQFECVDIHSAPFFGQSPASILKGLFTNLKGASQARKLIREYRPECVVGFGGYASVPVVLAARLSGVPVVLHEQNVVPSWSNRFCAIFAKKVALSFAESRRYFGTSAVVIGNLIREEFFKGNSTDEFNLRKELKTVLIFGGSGGARSINEAVHAGLEKMVSFKDKVQFLHLTGNKEDTDRLQKKYKDLGFIATVMDYCHQMRACYNHADLAVCRSGASAVSELAATRTPAILIPFPSAVADHQRLNAEVLEKLGSAVIVSESKERKNVTELTDTLARTMNDLLVSDEKLRKMREGYNNFPIPLERSSSAMFQLVQDSANPEFKK